MRAVVVSGLIALTAVFSTAAAAAVAVPAAAGQARADAAPAPPGRAIERLLRDLQILRGRRRGPEDHPRRGRRTADRDLERPRREDSGHETARGRGPRASRRVLPIGEGLRRGGLLLEPLRPGGPDRRDLERQDLGEDDSAAAGRGRQGAARSACSMTSAACLRTAASAGQALRLDRGRAGRLVEREELEAAHHAVMTELAVAVKSGSVRYKDFDFPAAVTRRRAPRATVRRSG
jgi:hypothetical protein